MKHYEKLLCLGCFTRKTLAEMLKSDTAAASLIYEYLRKGYIERVRHNLYAVISLQTKQPVLSRYQIGASLFPDAYLTHHSAFEVYGYGNQVFYEVWVATASRFKDFSYDGIMYHRAAPTDNASVIMMNSVKVTSIEQTVIDSIRDCDRISGLEETIRCMLLVPSLNSTELLKILKNNDNGFLYQKTGYLLEMMNDSLNLPKSFFEECGKHISSSKKYLTENRNGYVFFDRWKLYAPSSIHIYINKGVNGIDGLQSGRTWQTG